MSTPTGWGRHSKSAFDALADDYDAARPSYPDSLFDALPPLAGRDVVDVGAGTGIASRGLLARGARVVAVDLGPGMLARARARTPDLRAVAAVAEHIPRRAACADLVTFAQAWHWVDVDVAAREAVRVLRPGGALAVWWNDVAADGLPWFEAQQERLEHMSPGYTRGYRSLDYGEGLRNTGLFTDVVLRTLSWERTLDLALYERWLRSKSYVAALGARLEEFLDAERASLAAAFPSGVVREPFTVRLWIARPR